MALETVDELFIHLWLRAAVAESGSRSFVELERKARNIRPGDGVVGKRYKWYLAGRRPSKRTILETSKVAPRASQWLDTPLRAILQGKSPKLRRANVSTDPVLLELEKWAESLMKNKIKDARIRCILADEVFRVVMDNKSTDWMKETRPQLVSALLMWVDQMLVVESEVVVNRSYRQTLVTAVYAMFAIFFAMMSVSSNTDPFFITVSVIMMLTYCALAVAPNLRDFRYSPVEKAGQMEQE